MALSAPAAYGGCVPESYTVAPLVLRHYRRTARDLPWRRTRDPYAVLVSEVMLQQTQAARVVPAYLRFLRRFPTLRALARASLGAVLREWSGLGYNRRARDLQRAARACPDGLPGDVAALDALPGVGRYTAGAIACFAFGARVAFADTNIRRVLGRVFLGRVATEREATVLDARAMPARHADLWHQALMDLGASLCRAAAPRCERCPLREICVARRTAPAAGARPGAAGGSLPTAAYKDSDRRVRGAIVRLLARRPTGMTTRAVRQAVGDARVPRLIAALVADRLIEPVGGRYRLPM